MIVNVKQVTSVVRKNTLNDLTIVVLTYCRQNYALRLMRYWTDKGVRVIVVDGTDTPIAQKNLQGLTESITYLHMPVGIYERLQSCLNLLSTRYVMLSGDDEFYLPSALMSCIKVLESDSSIVACCGRSLAFEPRDGNIYGYPFYPKLKNYSLMEDNPKTRVINHMSNYVPSLIYAVSKTIQWKKVWTYLLQHEFAIQSITELQFELSMAYVGKSKVIPELMWLRSLNENPPTRGTDPSLSESIPFHTWWTSDQFFIEREQFIIFMKKLLRFLKRNKRTDHREIVMAGFNAYARETQKSFRSSYLNSLNPLIILKFLDRKSLLKKIKKNLRKILGWDTCLTRAALNLQKQGVKVDQKEIEYIQEILRDFHGYRRKIY